MNEWISVENALPIMDSNIKNASVDVRIKTDKGNVYKGFYIVSTNDWWFYKLGSARLCRETVTHWRKL